MNSTLIAIITAVCYLTGGIFIGVRLFGDRDAKFPPRILGIALGLLAVLLHPIVLYQGIITAEGFNLPFFHAASLVTWIIALVLMLSALNKPIENLGIVLLPIATIAIALDLLYPSSYLLPQANSLGMRLHILLSLLSYSLFTLAAVQSGLLAVQNQHLHNRHPGGFVRALPPLQTMEALLFEMIGLGFILLSLGLITGFMFLEDMFSQHLVHKTLLSLMSWVVFAVLLWGRFRFGWRGRIAIRWTMAGFMALMLAYFGSKAVVELIL
ncbi:inner membrane protein YpjD [Pseudomonadota bacterium]